MLAQLTADPSSYAARGRAYPGPYTLPALEDRGPPDKCRACSPRAITAAKPNTGFTTPAPEAGGVVVTFVAGPAPTFEEVRPDLEQQAADKVDQAGRRAWSTTSARTSV